MAHRFDVLGIGVRRSARNSEKSGMMKNIASYVTFGSSSRHVACE